MSAIVKLSAIILSDGDIDFKRYTTSFTESKEVVESIISELQEIEGIKLNWKVDKHHNSYRARVYSKKLARIMQNFIKSFRTRPHGVYPFCADKNCKECKNRKATYKEIKLPPMSHNDKMNFLRYYSTCDGGPTFRVRQRKSGSVQIDYAIKIGCCNPSLRKQIAEMFIAFDINASIKPDAVEIRDLESIKKFYNKIGFLDSSNVRRGRLFKNYKKNNVLKIIMLCGALTKKGHWITKNFKNINNTEKFLVNLISLVEKDNYDDALSFIKDNTNVSLSPVVNRRVS